MKQIKAILISLLFVALLGSAYAWFFVWNKPQQNIKQAAAININATDLFNAYSLNEAEANKTYIDKVVAVTGEVSNVSTNSQGKTVVLLKSDDLMFGVNCTLEEAAAVKNGETITLKGLCTGYLTDVVLIRCYKLNDTNVQL
jgi:flagellar basal body-associated protein FliL